MPLRMSEFKCLNGRGDIACVHATQLYEEVRLELVKSYPRNKMRVADHIQPTATFLQEEESSVVVQ
jgi:hypothetical protein